MSTDSITSILNLFPSVRIDGRLFLDFWNSYKVTEEFRLQVQNLDYYLVGSSDRWDLISQQVYGDRSLWWVIVLFNDIEDPFSLYFDLDVDKSIKKLRILKQENVGVFLNSVRDYMLKMELQRTKKEEFDNNNKSKVAIL
jgi:hypothetical protein